MQINNFMDMFHSHELALPNCEVVYETNEDAPGFDECIAQKSVVYNQDVVDDADKDEVILVNEETIQKGYLFVANAYRGEGVYFAILKVGDIWYECDLINDGTAYSTDMTDEQVADLVSNYQSEEE